MKASTEQILGAGLSGFGGLGGGLLSGIGDALSEKGKLAQEALDKENVKPAPKSAPPKSPPIVGGSNVAVKPVLGSFKHGGVVPKTGTYKLHEGEEVKSMADKYSPKERHSFHRAMSHLNGGALHRHFGIPEGEPIPEEKKQEAANSDNPHVAKMGHMALAMAKWHKGKAKK
jgi:hypothetical protein